MSHEALKISHTFSMDDSGMQTCLFQHKTIVSEHMFTSLIIITMFGGGSGEHIPTIVEVTQQVCEAHSACSN